MNNKIYLLSPIALVSAANFEELVPEVAALKGVQQPPQYHAEGDAFVHTCLAVNSLSDSTDERIQWAVLLHDIGKSLTTRCVNGRWQSHDHDKIGADMVPTILQRFGKEQISADVVWLVRHHHFALSWGIQQGKPLSRKQRRFCQHPLFPLLIQVVKADAAASYGESGKGFLVDQILSQL
ncbi:MAG: hypothetical protein B6I36_10925 [Desulfobacteraceae bacterium 4572_35.1]|nr:MAG: hypothetical protein B6I36_10925 [Desulfobacteraceae bacterium 4572_35.1]